MADESLGEFEQIVMLAILRLDGEVYGVRIVDEIEACTGRKVSRAAVYVTLRRLERKGLLVSRMGDPAPGRGGRARRCVRVRPDGVRMLRASRQRMDGMWQGLDGALEERP